MQYHEYRSVNTLQKNYIYRITTPACHTWRPVYILHKKCETNSSWWTLHTYCRPQQATMPVQHVICKIRSFSNSNLWNRQTFAYKRACRRSSILNINNTIWWQTLTPVHTYERAYAYDQDLQDVQIECIWTHTYTAVRWHRIHTPDS